MSARESVSSTAQAAETLSGSGVELRLEAYRVELTGYCYRMLGSSFEAEDAVQETMVRAWRGAGGFEGRSSVRSWLYRIATNVCLDSLDAGRRRARPIDLSPASRADAVLPGMTHESMWVEPVPDVRALPSGGDPAEVVVSRETIRLAFVAALQHLPPRQRAVLILREVLAWKASETAELLETTVASVNSALQRARATMAAAGVTTDGSEGNGDTGDTGDTDVRAAARPPRRMDKAQETLLARYVDAFERYDLDLLTSLLHEDATLSMPPYPMWLRGPDQIREWFLGAGIGCEGSRLLPVAANGAPGFAQYRRSPSGDGHRGWALQVLDITDGAITGLNSFLDTTRLFPLFGLPLELPVQSGEFE